MAEDPDEPPESPEIDYDENATQNSRIKIIPAESIEMRATSLMKNESLLSKLQKDYDKEVDNIIDNTMKMLSTKFCGSGFYQIMMVVIISLSWSAGIALHGYVIIFAGFNPDHKCQTFSNTTQPVSQCYILNITTNQTYECDKWVYDKSQMKSTIITEYDLVCKRNYYFESLSSIENVGYIIGGIACSWLANQFGKKPTFHFLLVSMTFLGFIQYWIQNLYVYIFVGFFINIFSSGLDSVCTPLVLEAFETGYRTRFGMLMVYIWAFVFVLLAPLAYLINTWRELKLAIFVIMGVLAACSFLFTQESLTWLISTGRLDEAESVIKNIAKINRLSRDEIFKHKFSKLKDVFQQLSKFNENKSEALKEFPEDKKNAYMEILKHKKFLFYLFLTVSTWGSAGLVYDGLTYLNASFGENIFINWVLMSTIEIPSQIFCHFVISRYGRRIVSSVSFILSGVTLIIAGFDLFPTYSFFRITVFAIAKFFISIAYTTIMIHSAEIFPTNIRSFCCGICIFSNRLSACMALFVSLYLGKLVPWLPAAIYGVLAIISGVLYLSTPETLNQPLPNSIKEITSRGENNKRKLCCFKE